MAKEHIYLGSKYSETISFTPINNSRNNKVIPDRDINIHADHLREWYGSAIKTALIAQCERQKQNLPVANGIYLDMDLVGGKLPLSQLDSQSGAMLMCVDEHTNQEITKATVFLPVENSDWLNKKLDQYVKPIEEEAKPANTPLINSIERIELSSVRSLFPVKREYDELEPNTTHYFEIWIDETEQEHIDSAITNMDAIGIAVIGDNIVHFESVTVCLVSATKEAIDDIHFALDKVEAVRLYHNPAEMLKSDKEAREWSQLIADDVEYNIDEHSVIVSVLDMGVNNGHQLLSNLLPDDRRDSAVDGVGVGHEGFHGTGMAGLVAYGDLNDLINQRGSLEVNHALASVKVLSNVHANDPLLYGRITENAIEMSSNMGADICCLAITQDEERNDGFPTSWSASLDKALYHKGACDRLLLVSAGDTQTSVIDHENYLDSLVTSSIQTPAQALNAITVGAYTVKTLARTEWTAIAPPEGLSPMTRTAIMWRGKNAKPDIVMEGGNVAHHDILGDSDMPELSLITTNELIPQQPLQYFNATSSATALAARLAAKIKTANPEVSMLTVRALMVHSAEWTEEMKHLGDTSTKIMEYCGYGVPDESRAVASDNTNATFIIEDSLVPFTEDGKYNEMRFYDLPWPKELLEQMHGETVKMRVTLSYYIEPSPGFKSKYNKYNYASSALSFDVKKTNETREQFIARNNKEEQVTDKSDNDSDRWHIRVKRRSVGTVQSDWIECSAFELAECNQIAVFPGSGWWKSRKIANVDNVIKYSLVVSIMTDETPIYDAVKVALVNAIQIDI